MEVLKELQAEIEKVENIEEFQNLFYKYANKLMNKYYLQIGDEKIELCEIEFYYDNCKNHHDKKTLGDDLQKTLGNLFFHEYGMDLTFGKQYYYGGILIRGIKHNKKYISGPLNVYNYLLDRIDNLKQARISLKKKTNKSNDNILHSTRKMGQKENKGFVKSLYRFISNNYLIASPKNDFYREKKNIPEISRIKLISYYTGILHELKENSDIQTQETIMKYDSKLKQNIKNFKKYKEKYSCK